MIWSRSADDTICVEWVVINICLTLLSDKFLFKNFKNWNCIEGCKCASGSSIANIGNIFALLPKYFPSESICILANNNDIKIKLLYPNPLLEIGIFTPVSYSTISFNVE